MILLLVKELLDDLIERELPYLKKYGCLRRLSRQGSVPLQRVNHTQLPKQLPKLLE